MRKIYKTDCEHPIEVYKVDYGTKTIEEFFPTTELIVSETLICTVCRKIGTITFEDE